MSTYYGICAYNGKREGIGHHEWHIPDYTRVGYVLRLRRGHARGIAHQMRILLVYVSIYTSPYDVYEEQVGQCDGKWKWK